MLEAVKILLSVCCLHLELVSVQILFPDHYHVKTAKKTIHILNVPQGIDFITAHNESLCMCSAFSLKRKTEWGTLILRFWAYF